MATTFFPIPIIPSVWAEGGQAQIPPATQAEAAAANRASFQMGWTVTTSTPVSEGGIPPNRLDFNGLGYVTTAYAYALQQGFAWTYNVDVANALGGYPKGAVLWYINNGVPQYLVQSLVENNVTADLTDSTKWQPLTINPLGFAMLGTLADQSAAQIRNIEIVEEEPETGVDGTIYAIIES